MDITQLMTSMAQRAKSAYRQLAKASTGEKNRALTYMAEGLRANEEHILKENARDVAAAREKDLSNAMIDRLMLTHKTMQEIAQGLLEVVALPDPVGEITGMWRRPNGLQVGRMRIPLGVIGFVYESRPNVTVDAAGLCLKSGNAVILKGGSEAIHSNLALAEILQESIRKAGLPEDAVQVVPTTDRNAVKELLSLEDWVDVIIPRGGEGLIRYVVQHSRIPVLKHYKGVCHVYIDAQADLAKALEICFNAKV